MRTLVCSFLVLFIACQPDDLDNDGYSVDLGDCDDSAADVNPDATEVCDQIDNNCDGQVDESSSVGALTLYVDADGDGFGDPNRMAKSCQPIPGWSTDPSDCNDEDALISPDATEQPGNGVDEDCLPESTD